MTRIVPVLIGAGVVFALVAAPAMAVPRFVSPGGSGTACSSSMPCDLETGVEGAANGDEVFVASGNYGTPGSPLASAITITADIDVHGIDGQPRPTLYTTAGVGMSLGNAGATLTHLGIVSSDDTGAALGVSSGLADRVYASGGLGSAVEGCFLSDTATLRNSVCLSAGFAVEASGSAILRGVTAWSTGMGGVGLEVKSGDITVISSILQAPTTDVRTNDTINLAPVAITLTYSNYDTATESSGDPVTDPGSGTNQTAPPQLVDPAMGDFHQLPASPTVDKGELNTVTTTGPFDFEGGPRMTGAAPDIGADEIAPPPGGGGPGSGGPGGGGPGGGGPGPGNGGGGGVDGSRPSLTAFAFSPSAFLPLTSGPSIPSATRGTRVLYELSERANVSFRVERSAPGRRVGRRCVRPTRRNSGRRRCVRWVRLRGGFTHAGVAGANSFRFSGRVRGRALRPGSHRLVATPVDLAGNRGKVARRGFRILRRR